MTRAGSFILPQLLAAEGRHHLVHQFPRDQPRQSSDADGIRQGRWRTAITVRRLQHYVNLRQSANNGN
jgi:hypothetical protein